MGVKVFIVLPDLSERKFEAIRLASSTRRLNILVSYTILRWKPAMVERLERLRRANLVESILLDSGAYHLMKLGEEVDVHEYSAFINSIKYWDLVVAPDVPGKPSATLERTILFSQVYEEDFVPVLQGDRPSEYETFLRRIDALGLVDRAPRVMSGLPLVGIGGLDGPKKKVGFVSQIVEKLSDYSIALHIFGVGSRVLRGLKKRGLLGKIYSVDSSGWLAEIQWRRRTVYGAKNTVEANVMAIHGYLDRVERAIAS